MIEKIKRIYELLPNRIVINGGEVYLNKEDSIQFVLECQKFKIPLHGIDIVKLTPNELISPLEKIIEFNDQIDVYEGAKHFLESEMDETWNYATFVVS